MCLWPNFVFFRFIFFFLVFQSKYCFCSKLLLLLLGNYYKSWPTFNSSNLVTLSTIVNETKKWSKSQTGARSNKDKFQPKFMLWKKHLVIFGRFHTSWPNLTYLSIPILTQLKPNHSKFIDLVLAELPKSITRDWSYKDTFSVILRYPGLSFLIGWKIQKSQLKCFKIA